MQTNILIALLALLTVPISITIIEGTRKLSQYHTLRRSISSHGCIDPPFENPYDFFGLVKIISLIRHLLNKTAIANATALFGKYGETYISRIIGEKVVFTCDPRNIKQVLVARSVDYDSSILRAHLFRHITEHESSPSMVRSGKSLGICTAINSPILAQSSIFICKKDIFKSF